MRLSTSPRRVIAVTRQCCQRHHSTEPSASTSTLATTPDVRVRFAPSPTGELHLGGLRTALLNHLVARQNKGKWVLRIEDTDRKRYVPGTVEHIRRSLDWAGLEYDEGVEVGGPYGPYYQSERLDLYRQHAQQLLDTDHAYECFCTVDELAAIKENLKAQGTHVAYDGRCRHLTDEDRGRRKRAGHSYVIRFKDPGGLLDLDMPTDIVFGQITPHTDSGVLNFDDFVVMKADGFPTYHLASVVDDHHMRISHVLRGQEWLSSLPKHVRLYRAFGWELPLFAHLPLLCGPDGQKLSKRRGDVTIDAYRERGYEPEALLNFLALLGWDSTKSLFEKEPPEVVFPDQIRHDEHSTLEVLSLPQLVQYFDLRHVTRRKAMVNEDKLNFLQRMHLRRKAGKYGPNGRLVTTPADEAEGKKELLEVFRAGLRDIETLKDVPLVGDSEYTEEVFDANFARITFINELAPLSTFYFVDPDFQAGEAESMFKSIKPNQYIRVLKSAMDLLPAMIASNNGILSTDVIWDLGKEITQYLGLIKASRGSVFLPLRHALTGTKKGPSVPEIIVVLGQQRTMARLRRALEYAQPKEASEVD